MDHPFTAKLELKEHQLDTVAGGCQIIILSASDVEKLKPVIKPAIGSTMAIGEEGGGFNYI